MRRKESKKSIFADTEVRDEGGEKVLQVWEPRFPCSLWRSPCRAAAVIEKGVRACNLMKLIKKIKFYHFRLELLVALHVFEGCVSAACHDAVAN